MRGVVKPSGASWEASVRSVRFLKPENSGGEGGILLPPLPASAGESNTFAIIPCV